MSGRAAASFHLVYNNFDSDGAYLPMDDPVLSACRVDRTAVSVAKLTDPPDDLAYWLSRPPEERWEAIELMRAD